MEIPNRQYFLETEVFNFSGGGSKSVYHGGTYIGHLKLKNGGMKIVGGTEDDAINEQREKVLDDLKDVLNGGTDINPNNIPNYYKALEGTYIRSLICPDDNDIECQMKVEYAVKHGYKLSKLLAKKLKANSKEYLKQNAPKLYQQIKESEYYPKIKKYIKKYGDKAVEAGINLMNKNGGVGTRELNSEGGDGTDNPYLFLRHKEPKRYDIILKNRVKPRKRIVLGDTDDADIGLPSISSKVLRTKTTSKSNYGPSSPRRGYSSESGGADARFSGNFKRSLSNNDLLRDIISSAAETLEKSYVISNDPEYIEDFKKLYEKYNQKYDNNNCSINQKYSDCNDNKLYELLFEIAPTLYRDTYGVNESGGSSSERGGAYKIGNREYTLTNLQRRDFDNRKLSELEAELAAIRNNRIVSSERGPYQNGGEYTDSLLEQLRIELGR